MEARDRTQLKTEYKGRLTACCDRSCPCRPCWNPHDCGYEQRVYNRNGLWTSNKHIVHMECATRHNQGCPDLLPEPEHIYKSDRANICRRCGYSRRQSRPTGYSAGAESRAATRR